MLSTTNDLRIGNIEQLRSPDMLRARNLIGLPQGDSGSSTAATSAKSAATVYPFAKPAHEAGPLHRGPGWIVRVWWERWLERRWFARVLPLLADEVLEDSGLTGSKRDGSAVGRSGWRSWRLALHEPLAI